MLKRIPVQQLVAGMYLNRFEGPWLKHPFWRTGFVLGPGELASIRTSPVAQVWIDSSKGLDLPAQPAAAAAPPAGVAGTAAPPAPAGAGGREPVAIAQEYARAASICQQSKQAVAAMFDDARLGKVLDTEAAQSVVREVADSVARNPGALISLARIRNVDDYTYMHSVAVCAMMVALARQLGLDHAHMLDAGMAGLLHDIGKIAMPDQVLNKPGALTAPEFELIKTHPAAGHQILLAGEGVCLMALDVCLHHHEKMDGSGYPEGLAGDDISLFAKMGAVTDVYDAVTSDRPYKQGWDPAESLRRMAQWTGSHFDNRVFQAFVKSLGIYPIGSLVRLRSGRLGVVMDQTEKSLTAPCVKVFYCTQSRQRIAPEVLDLSRAPAQDRIVAREDPAPWGFADLNALWLGSASAVL